MQHPVNPYKSRIDDNVQPSFIGSESIYLSPEFTYLSALLGLVVVVKKSLKRSPQYFIARIRFSKPGGESLGITGQEPGNEHLHVIHILYRVESVLIFNSFVNII